MKSDGGDIGNLFRANKRLERELVRLETFFNAINSSILMINERGIVGFSNSFARDFFSISGSDRFSIYKLLPALEESVEAALVSRSPTVCELNMTYPDARSLRAQIVPLEGDEDRRLALVFTDITSEKLSTAEKIESEKISSILNLAAGVAHELGNPLNSINIHLQLAKRRIKKLSPTLTKTGGSAENLKKIAESVDVCTEEVSRLDAIIENFLKAIRPMRPDLRECDALKPLVETLKVLEAELHNLNITVEVSSNSHLPQILGDENLLKQLYFNILKNAMEAMDAGGKISVQAIPEDTFVKISFADTGCGIQPEDISRLFRPYFTTKPDGHGLGMMIIDNIVRSHGGKINVESAIGKGTKITVFLPRSSPNVRMLNQ